MAGAGRRGGGVTKADVCLAVSRLQFFGLSATVAVIVAAAVVAGGLQFNSLSAYLQRILEVFCCVAKLAHKTLKTVHSKGGHRNQSTLRLCPDKR